MPYSSRAEPRDAFYCFEDISTKWQLEHYRAQLEHYRAQITGGLEDCRFRALQDDSGMVQHG